MVPQDPLDDDDVEASDEVEVDLGPGSDSEGFDGEDEEASEGDEEEPGPGGDGATNTTSRDTAVTGPALAEAVSLSAGTSDAALLALEINELLSESRSRVKETQVNDAIQLLKKQLASIPPHEVKSSTINGFVKELGVQEFPFTFQPPTNVQVVGSHASGTMLRTQQATIDVAVEIPESCVFKKAHLNYRYHARRALYLATLSKHLAKHPAFTSQELCALQDDPRRPALLLHPSLPAHGSSSAPGSGSSRKLAGFKIRLLPCLSPSAFPVPRLAPDRNSIRSVCKKLAPGTAPTASTPTDVDGEGVPAGTVLLPTPHYNADVAIDLLMVPLNRQLVAACGAVRGLSDGILLMKVWARQRGLAQGPDGLPPFMLAMMMVALAQSGKLSPAMTPLQMLRAGLQALSEPSGLAKGLAMARDCPLAASATEAAPHAKAWAASLEGLPQGGPGLEVFKARHDVVLVDPSGWLNLAAHTTKAALGHAQLLARQTLAVLAAPKDPHQAFVAALQAAEGPTGSFDYYWRVTLPDPPGSSSGAAGSGSEQPSLCQDRVAWREEEQRLESVVKQALSDRARVVRASRRPLPPTPIPSGASPDISPLLHCGLPRPPTREVLLAAIVDPAKASRIVDTGPAADNDKLAARFRAFWGPKAELRRFPDGTICEAVVWEAVPLVRRHTIPDCILEYGLPRHFPGATVVGCSGSLDAALASRHIDLAASQASERIMDAALERISKQLRNLKDTALKVVGIQQLSANTRRTAPFLPQPHPLAGAAGGAGVGGRLPRCVDPIELLVQLENSGRWPSDPVAFRKAKAALGIQLASALESAYGLTCVCSEECIDVLADGFAFRLTLYSGRDDAMLTAAAAAASGKAPEAVAAAAAAAATAAGNPISNPITLPPAAPGAAVVPEEMPLRRVWHAGLVALVSGSHPAYAPTVRLASRWLACHLLANHVRHEAVELMVAAAFTGPATRPAPGSRLAGFHRFLALLSSHPWPALPLVVDPQGEMGEGQRREALRRHSQRRQQDAGGSGLCMAIVTPRDLDGTVWTRPSPSPEVLTHLVALADKALRRLQRLVLHGAAAPAGSSSDWLAPLFSPALEDFDALLLLRKEALPYADRALPLSLPKPHRQPTLLAALLQQGHPPGSDDDEEDNAAKRKKGGDKPEPPPKRARVFLRHFPEQVVEAKSTQALRAELLVGFEPLGPLLGVLQAQYGHLALFCADCVWGSPVVGVRWKATAFRPHGVGAQPLLCHTDLPLAMTGQALGREGALSCVPNLPGLLREMREVVGLGLVEDVVLPTPSCSRLPRGQ